MKLAYFNPTIFAIADVPQDVLQWCQDTVNLAHTQTNLDDSKDPTISIRGGQQIQLLPNEFNLDTATLATFIEKSCQDYLDNIAQSAGVGELPLKPVLVSAWTIKQQQDHYQALHSHEAHISGNIYVEAPDLDPNSTNTDSCLEFRLPTVRNPARFVFHDNWKFKPEVGKMIMFPSYIPHAVYPWKGTGNRTVIAWDVHLVAK